uniref:Small nuclear ribonucleoprotein Sm D3 n=1 Tax=Oryzias sinensis TaxID=183150 RepID=A0A8C7XB86_9TELE
MSIGVPIKVLHEAEGHIVTCETNTGEVYRGKLIEAEDNMNCQMSNITVTYRDGRVAQLEQVYIRGSKIRFLILPDMLKNAPMLKSMKNKNQGSGAGRGKAAILKAQGEWFLTNADKWCVHFSLILGTPCFLNAVFFFFFFVTELFLNFLSPLAVAARGRGRGGMGRGNIFQKRR